MGIISASYLFTKEQMDNIDATIRTYHSFEPLVFLVLGYERVTYYQGMFTAETGTRYVKCSAKLFSEAVTELITPIADVSRKVKANEMLEYGANILTALNLADAFVDMSILQIAKDNIYLVAQWLRPRMERGILLSNSASYQRLC